jgi:hypothetical protein
MSSLPPLSFLSVLAVEAGLPYVFLIAAGAFRKQTVLATFSLLASHEDVYGGEEASIGLIGDLFCVYLDCSIEEEFKVLPPGLLAVDDLKLGGEVVQIEVDVLEVHADDFIEGFELAVSLEAAQH